MIDCIPQNLSYQEIILSENEKIVIDHETVLVLKVH